MSIQDDSTYTKRHRRTRAEKVKDQDDVYDLMFHKGVVKLNEMVAIINEKRGYTYTVHHAQPDRNMARGAFRDVTAYDPRTTLNKARHIEEIAREIFKFEGIGSTSPHDTVTVKTEVPLGEDVDGGGGTQTTTSKTASLSTQAKQYAELLNIADKMRRGVHTTHKESTLMEAVLRRDERAHETAVIARAQEERKVQAIEAAAGAGNVQIVVAGAVGAVGAVGDADADAEIDESAKADKVIAQARAVLDKQIKANGANAGAARRRRSALMSDAENLRMETMTVEVLDGEGEKVTRTAEETEKAIAAKRDALARLRDSITARWGLGGVGWSEFADDVKPTTT